MDFGLFSPCWSNVDLIVFYNPHKCVCNKCIRFWNGNSFGELF